MEMKEVKQLLKEFEASKLQKMTVKLNGDLVSFEKPQVNVISNSQVSFEQPTSVNEAQPVEITNDKNSVKAPLVGVFYAASSPEAKPYVSIGDKVSEGQTLCIIEAMKSMNEISSPKSGTVTNILVDNGSMVSIDQPLFIIE